MKLYSIAVAALFAVTTGAPLAAQDWDGWYVGIGAANNSYTPDFVNGEKTFSINGFDQPFPVDEGSSTGAYVLGGRLWQKGALVFGAELDLSNIESRIAQPAPYVSGNEFTMCGTDPCINIGTFGSLTTKGHLRGVFGYSFSPRLLGFASLGVAAAESDPRGVYVRGNIDDLIGGAAVSRDNVKTIYGPSIGIGGQYKLNDKLTFRAEILHDQFRHKMKPVGGVGFGGVAGDGTAPDVYYSTGQIGGDHIAEIESTTARIALIWEF